MSICFIYDGDGDGDDEYTNLFFFSASCSFYSYTPHFPSPSLTIPLFLSQPSSPLIDILFDNEDCASFLQQYSLGGNNVDNEGRSAPLKAGYKPPLGVVPMTGSNSHNARDRNEGDYYRSGFTLLLPLYPLLL